MNSLNILSHIGTPPPSPPRSRAASESNILAALPRSGSSPESPNNAGASDIASLEDKDTMDAGGSRGYTAVAGASASDFDEKTPLLTDSNAGSFSEAKVSKAWLIPKRISEAFIGTVKLLISVVVAPGRYVVTCFYDDNGQFSLRAPIYKFSRSFSRKPSQSSPEFPKVAEAFGADIGRRRSRRTSGAQTRPKRSSAKRSPSIASASTAITSDSEQDSERPLTRDEDRDTPSNHTRSKSMLSASGEEIAPARRSIRIKLHNDEALRQRKVKKQSRSSKAPDRVSAEAAAALKSPTSPATASSTKITKFPRAPQPPRPLVPRRQPSYSTSAASNLGPHQKTLIIDLDETLIHSMAKGGRYTTGHMVEVKLQQPMGVGGGMIGPQVPILYYVHKRPYCDEFLKKVCRIWLPRSPIGLTPPLGL